MTLTRRTAAIVACVAVFVSGAPEVGVASASPTTTPAPSTSLSLTKCPALYVFAVQGTGESSPDAAPSTDTGMLSLVMRPMMAAASDPGLVDRAYVPYPAGFGGAVGASIVPYAESVATGVLRTESMMAQLHSVCPRTRVGLVSYSQGSHVASIVAQQIGAGHGVVDPSVVAAVILMADPTRSPGTGLFPGTEASAPAPAPGTSGEHLAALPAAPVRSGVAGGGIGPQRDIAEDFGALTGRVASVCVSGDLACDTPEESAILRAAAGVASQSLLSAGDPIGSLISIGQALAYTSLNAAVTVLDDTAVDSHGASSISPQKSISQRLADASDPRTGVDVNAALAAVTRVGTIGFDAVNAVVASVLNPAALTQLAAVALSNPAAAVSMVGEKFTSAVADLVAPTTGDRLVSTAFDVVRREVADNRDLLDLTTWVRIWEPECGTTPTPMPSVTDPPLPRGRERGLPPPPTTPPQHLCHRSAPAKVHHHRRPLTPHARLSCRPCPRRSAWTFPLPPPHQDRAPCRSRWWEPPNTSRHRPPSCRDQPRRLR
ncbi:cutinase family protein [Nocardia fluminea]|uniref:cutinase family protein n=1 Tax=Nocardia fluminea TaxID=134984 RepID=UPI00365830FE